MIRISIFFLVFLSMPVFAEIGVVFKEDVCGAGNAILKTTDGLYISAEYNKGVYLYAGDTVSGNLRTFGLENITREDGETGSFYILNYIDDIDVALEELCE